MPVAAAQVGYTTLVHTLIEAHRAELLALPRRRGVTGVQHFDSMSRDDGSDTSDVDLIVTLAPGTSALTPGRFVAGCAGIARPPCGCRLRSKLSPRAAQSRDGKRRAAVNPGPDADRVLLAHTRDCLDRLLDYTNAERSRFDTSRLVLDAVIRNLQTLAESS